MVVNELFQYAFIFVHTILRISGCQPTYSADLERKDLSSHCASQESQTFSSKFSHTTYTIRSIKKRPACAIKIAGGYVYMQQLKIINFNS